ncbi:hypothetical protein BGW39_008872 [Mortierella sp. 14UC]|nr:hypothetical protein BGW39_008872 [Mortierella sp. 14UC]
MSGDHRLTIFCLEDGNPLQRAFSIEIAAEDFVADIKDLIKAECTITLKNIAANNLVLWRVSIPDTEDYNGDRTISLSDIPDKEKKKLRPTTCLLKVFPDGSPEDTVHVVYQRPLPVVLPLLHPRVAALRGYSSSSSSKEPRPSSKKPRVGFRAVLDEITEKFFNPDSQHAKFLKEFVQGSHGLPDSSISGLPTVGMRKHFGGQRVPTLLFYNLPSSSPVQPSQALMQAERILADHPEKRLLPLFGVRGCGKTRAVMELLSESWGLYLNASSNEYGSEDMDSIIENLYYINLTNSKKHNTAMVQYIVFGLLYARLLILEHCLRTAGSRDTFTCQRWMLLQVATPAFPDVFLALFAPIRQHLHSYEVSRAFVRLVKEQFARVRRLLHYRTPSTAAAHSKFLLVLDESHRLGRIYQTHFLGVDGETVRPLLYPILRALMDLEGRLDGNTTCVLPCSTGSTSYEPQWMGDCAVSDNGLSDMVVDFAAGWTNVASITNYLTRLGEGLDDEVRVRLERLIPPEAVLRLFRDMGGRFGMIIYTIQSIIAADYSTAWENCIQRRVDYLTKATGLTNEYQLGCHRGNFCVELKYMIRRVEQQEENNDKVVAMTEIRNAEATLRVARDTFKMQGACLALKGLLSRLVETGFGRFTVIDGEIYTTIDEPLTLRAADNYVRMVDEYNDDRLGTAITQEVASLGREGWATGIPHEMVRIFHDKVVSTRLFQDTHALLPQDMIRRQAFIVGWSTHLRTRSPTGGLKETTMAEFLDAHINNHSECDGDPVPPFLYPGDHSSNPGQGPGPDIVFVVRFRDGSSGGSRASSLFSDIVCPVVVQVKLSWELPEVKVIDARFCTVQPTEIESDGFDMRQYCQPTGGHYIRLVVGRPAYNDYRNIMDDERITVNEEAHTFNDDDDAMEIDRRST